MSIETALVGGRRSRASRYVQRAGYVGFAALVAVAAIILTVVIAGRDADATRTAASPAPEESVQPAPTDSDVRLLFADEFDGPGLDRRKWVTCYWWDDDGCTNRGNNELQWYRDENVRVAEGTAQLTAQRATVDANDGRRYRYTSGMLTTGRLTEDLATPPRFVFQYGYVEVKARVPSGKGLWPAIWLLPARQEPLPEIDIMEILGHEPDKLYMTVHFDSDDGPKKRQRNWRGPDFSDDWHTFGVDWQPEAITWYVDGVPRTRYTNTPLIPAEPMYLLLNLAVGGDWPGSPNSATRFPSSFDIDYVRVWNRMPAVP